MKRLSGNHAAWLSTTATELREAGKPVSLNFLVQVVPSQFATSTNDGHVTAAANGLDRNDYRAGQRIWIEEAVAALRKAKLVDGPDDALEWIADQDGTWRVPFRPKIKPTIYGRAESAAARDRHMLGNGDSPGYLLKGWSETTVEVEVGAGSFAKGRHTLQVHPLALAIPPMTAAEQEAVRADIAEHGVRMPLILYPDQNDRTARGRPKEKVLDGRHRLQFASALDKPVKVEMFEGTELEARQYVASLNLHRRQLTKEQRALAIVRLFGEQAKVEAAEALANGQIRGNKSRGSSVTESSPTRDVKSKGEKAYERAWELAGGNASGVTKNAVRQVWDVVDAPETAAAVDAGEITSFAEANAAAREELGKPKQTKQDGRTNPTSQSGEMRRAIGHVKVVLEEDDLPPGATLAELEAYAGTLIDLARTYENRLIAQRGTALSSR